MSPVIMSRGSWQPFMHLHPDPAPAAGWMAAGSPQSADLVPGPDVDVPFRLQAWSRRVGMVKQRGQLSHRWCRWWCMCVCGCSTTCKRDPHPHSGRRAHALCFKLIIAAVWPWALPVCIKGAAVLPRMSPCTRLIRHGGLCLHAEHPGDALLHQDTSVNCVYIANTQRTRPMSA